ncbi:uncharacterized protein PRCAT00002167001 [Priceomyces carsonii]|uniref:uncharacterized protein n=1 Tax=Priceomyces carsonii TaxID=28549 RepID=UPI002ED84433|nr:unnamed protein product [Priceomyces carsonii]
MAKPKVLIVGAGGVGTICALGLTLNDLSDVTLVVRSDYDYVKEHGYTINSVTYGNIEHWRPNHISRTVTEAFKSQGEFDYIVLTTKNIPDGPITCEEIIEPAVTDKTTIILVQNGYGIEVPMIKRFPKNLILSGVSLIGSSNIKCVIENLHKDQIYIGLFKNQNVDPEIGKSRIKDFIEIYQSKDDKNKVMIDDDVEKRRWEKLIYNAVFNTTTSLVNLDINRCQMNNANDTVFRPAMKEIVAIAASEGVEIASLTLELFLHIGDGLFYSPSMCVDMRKNQLLELEVILGNPLRVAERNGVPTPCLSLLYSLLKMVQFRIKEERGLIKIDKSKFTGNSDEFPRILAETNK